MFSDYRLSNYWQRIALPAISPERGRYIERTQISANVEPDGKSPDSGFRTIEQSDRVCRTLSDSVESAPRGQREGPSENMCFQTWGHRAAVDQKWSFVPTMVNVRSYRKLPTGWVKAHYQRQPAQSYSVQDAAGIPLARGSARCRTSTIDCQRRSRRNPSPGLLRRDASRAGYGYPS